MKLQYINCMPRKIYKPTKYNLGDTEVLYEQKFLVETGVLYN